MTDEPDSARIEGIDTHCPSLPWRSTGHLRGRTGQPAGSEKGAYAGGRRHSRCPAAPADGGDRPHDSPDRTGRSAHRARCLRRAPTTHRLLLHVAPTILRPSSAKAAPGSPPRSRSCRTCTLATSLRGLRSGPTTRASATTTSWAGACRYSAPQDSRAALLVGRRVGRMHIVCSCATATGFFETYWTPSRRRGHGLQLRADGPDGLRTTGGVGGLASGLAPAVLQSRGPRAARRIGRGVSVAGGAPIASGPDFDAGRSDDLGGATEVGGRRHRVSDLLLCLPVRTLPVQLSDLTPAWLSGVLGLDVVDVTVLDHASATNQRVRLGLGLRSTTADGPDVVCS